MMDMLKAIFEFIFGLVPDENATPAAHKRWRKRIGMTVGGLVLVTTGVVITILSFLGKFPYLETPFVRKSDLDSAIAQQKTEMQSISNQLNNKIGTVSDAVTKLGNQARFRYSEQIDSSILDALAKCHDAKTGDARRLYMAQVSHLVEQYRANNDGRDPPNAGDGYCRP